MNAVILGSNSDIAKGITPMLEADGWKVFGWNRNTSMPMEKWSLLISTIGRVSPVGHWWNNYTEDWQQCVHSNLMLPFTLLRNMVAYAEEPATVCFMAGSNPQKVMDGYSAYNCSKMGLLKLVEQMDAEASWAKVFALGPGYVQTKIHEATLQAHWPNERIARGDSGTSIEKIYDCLKWCLAQPKEVVGGRNICVSDPYGPELAERLKANGALYKLRRVE